MKVHLVPADILNRQILLQNQLSQHYCLVSVDCRVELDPAMDESEQSAEAFCHFDLVFNAEGDVGEFEAGLREAAVEI